MCGIIGVFNNEKSRHIVSEGLKVMKNRGIDASQAMPVKSGCLGHNLHAVVDFVKQPIKRDGSYIVANCEIYNWKALNAKYRLGAKNDAEMLLKFIQKRYADDDSLLELLDELDGVYAFCYYEPEKGLAILARDIMGEKPLWYSLAGSLAFASEKKALLASEMYDVTELNPRKILLYNAKENKARYIDRNFFEIGPELIGDAEKIKKELISLIRDAVKKRLTDRKTGLLFSGGIDSVFIAFMLKKLGADFTCYTAVLDEKGMDEAEDLTYAIKAAKMLGLKLKVKRISLAQTERYLKKIIPLIEDSGVVKCGVALPFYIAAEEARLDGVKMLFSGLGSEELFAGYERHLHSQDVNMECRSGLLKMYERDLYRDDVVTMANCTELRLPFLDKHLIEYALRIPASLKIDEENKKIILRLAAIDLGIPLELAHRKKKAAQYGSKFDRAIQKLAARNGFKYKSDYLNSLYKIPNAKLGVMWSSGKDSAYAAYLMKRHNYEIKCLLTVKSRNKYSYMFHTPNLEMAKIQAEAMDVPIMMLESEGEKEEELADLVKLLASAKEEFRIDGIVTGALFSTYQRERLERAADSLGLKIFSPLWHKDQEDELRELIEAGFKFIFSSVAADGLDDSWLGKEITEKDIDRLAGLGKRLGINVAGEGGEYESLVLDCPLFKKRIIIKKGRIEKEGRYNYFYVIDDAILEDKK